MRWRRRADGAEARSRDADREGALAAVEDGRRTSTRVIFLAIEKKPGKCAQAAREQVPVYTVIFCETPPFTESSCGAQLWL